MQKRCSAVAVILLITLQSFAQSPAPSSADVERRVDSILRQMTLEEKIDLLAGVDRRPRRPSG